MANSDQIDVLINKTVLLCIMNIPRPKTTITVNLWLKTASEKWRVKFVIRKSVKNLLESFVFEKIRMSIDMNQMKNI